MVTYDFQEQSIELRRVNYFISSGLTLLENRPELYNSQIPDPVGFKVQLNETQPETPMHKLAHTLYPPTASYAVSDGPLGEGSIVVCCIETPEQ